MNFMAFLALVRRDLRLFFLDKRAMTMSFVAPIVIGSFFGYLFGGVDQDRAAVEDRGGGRRSGWQRGLAAGGGIARARAAARGESGRSLDDARAAVRAGKTTVAAVIPPGFGERAVRSLFRGPVQPEIELLYDPSHAPELAMVRGVLTQHVMEVVSAEAASAAV